MKRVALLCLGLALGAANAAEAQLTMQMSNGWSFTFAGNVNAFIIYQQGKTCTPPGGDCATSSKDNSFGTGLLPAFAVFDAKGKEDNLDLGVHFGFAPQIETGGHFASFFGSQAAGAQIDMRQVYLTAGGTWGQLLMGKELGVFLRGNILNDMTLLGVGVGGGGRGTALGRIGYGYLYTDFRPQLTYSTPSGKSTSFAIGLFEGIGALNTDPAGPSYETIQLPRVEAEFAYNGKSGENTNIKFFINGAVQTAKSGPSGDTDDLTSTGGGGGATVDISGFALHASGFYAKGMGSLFMGDACCGPDDSRLANDGIDSNGDGRNSFGYIGQIVYMKPDGKWGVGASYGENHLKRTDDDQADDGTDEEILKRRAIVGQITYKWSKSLRWVAEYGHIQNFSDGEEATKSDQGSIGMMLFF
jgi:hypothetical protein